MNTEIYKLFLECFPQFPMTEAVFNRLLDTDKCEIITHGESGKLAGFTAVDGNCIRLICVSPEFRGKGIGHTLMQKSEELIAKNGFKKAVLGGQDSEFFIGAVTPEEQWKNMQNEFFENEGYRARNGCLEMRMNMSDFDFEGLDIPPCPDNVTFGYISKDRKDELLTAVEKVSEEWVQYFTFDSPIFAAEIDGKIAGFCIVDIDVDTIISTDKNSVGMVGCVGTVPEHRRKGIGLAMAANAVQDAKQKGCDEIFIHYTYLDWWYGKLGFKTFLHYWFGEKELQKMISHKFYNELPDEAKLIRNEVFVDEQGFYDEFDDNDKKCLHVVLFDDDIPIATGRTFPESGSTYTIGRIAVRKPYRGKNIGAEVMKLLETKVKELGADTTAVSAQCRAQGFYEKIGYTASGDIYFDQYCEHIHMEKKI